MSLLCYSHRAFPSGLGLPQRASATIFFQGTRLSMKYRFAVRAYAVVAVMLASVLCAVPAQAQFRPRPLNDPATGEKYHIEASAAWWFPSANIVVSSAGFGIPGTS